MNIHEQLLADCHRLGRLSSGVLLLHRNAALPWFILVPDSELQDVLDLPPVQREQVLADCAAVSAFIKRELGCYKVNFAGLGNQVPQMHLHLIGRSVGDACWPQPVWGNVADGGDYKPIVLETWREGLVAGCGLVDE